MFESTKKVAFEDTIVDDWDRDLDTLEIPLNNRPFLYLGIAVGVVVILLMSRIVYLGFNRGALYRDRAQGNSLHIDKLLAPRGLIYDRNGQILAENTPVFVALLDMKAFADHPELQSDTMQAAEKILGIGANDFETLVSGAKDESSIILNANLSESQLIELKGLNLPTLVFQSGFQREYHDGAVFSPILGYTGLPTKDNLAHNQSLTNYDLIGKTGLEFAYDESLRGVAGEFAQFQDAKGTALDRFEKQSPENGKSLTLTVDGEFQKYFYDRMLQGLRSLGRNIGAGIAINPQNGEILALVDFPSFDNNLFAEPGHSKEKQALLIDPSKPLFNRAISGTYNPGSTIKPLVGIAALHEGIISPGRQIFSPGYLDIPNPYNPAKPTRYLDWRYQGNVNLAAAIAQSSNVYFYSVGGGANGIKGLGIDVLRNWWQKFNLGTATGIDLPGEAAGFLPSIDWKAKTSKRSWLLGDTYNVSIGQGDLSVTPIQILNYIAAIANNGKMFEPTVVMKDHPTVIKDLSNLLPEINEVRKGMRQAVISPLGTAHLLVDLPFPIGAKTGSAQVQNNTEENAFFVGYAPENNPQIAILVLIENSKEGSLNAVPIAKDVLNWYYENRINKTSN